MLLNQQTDPSNVESVKNALKNRKTWHSFFYLLQEIILDQETAWWKALHFKCFYAS